MSVGNCVWLPSFYGVNIQAAELGASPFEPQCRGSELKGSARPQAL